MHEAKHENVLLWLLGLLMGVVFWAVVAFGADVVAATLVMWTLHSFGIPASYWTSSLLAGTVEFLMVLAVIIGVKVAKA